MLNVEDVKWIEDTKKDVEVITKRMNDVSEIVENENIEKREEIGVIGKMKNFVKKAVNCCIE